MDVTVTLENESPVIDVQVIGSGPMGPQGPQGIQGEQGVQGEQGPPGQDGADGAPGVGVPSGGTTGQVLKKSSSTDYDTAWDNPDVFWATKDSTTSAEIEAAYQAGKLVCVEYNDRVYPLVYRESSTKHRFMLIYANNVYSLTCTSDVWSTGTYTLAQSSSVPSAASNNPADLGTAAKGSSSKYAREDHVHKMPSASDVGAVPSGQGIPSGGSTGQVLKKSSGTDYAVEWANGGGGAVDSVNGQTGTVVLDADDVGALANDTKYAGASVAGGAATKAVSIPFGALDNTSTDTAMTATVDGITALADGVCVWLKNGVATSASGVTLNINSLGAKPIYSSQSAATAITTQFNVNYTALLVYNSTRVTGGCWDFVYGYDSNTTYTPLKLGFGYATCSSAEATPAKTATLSSYTLVTNGIVSIKFTNAVGADATLNINSKGSKALYYKNSPITAGIIKAGDTATFIYSTYYHLISIDRQPDKTDVGLGNVDNVQQYSANNPPPYPVTSVNGSTGAVTTPDTTYTISISGNVITLTPSSGAAQSITLPVYNGGVS